MNKRIISLQIRRFVRTFKSINRKFLAVLQALFADDAVESGGRWIHSRVDVQNWAFLKVIFYEIWDFVRRFECVNFVLKFVRTHLLKSSTEQYLYYHKGVLFLLGAVENFSSSLMGQWSWYLFFLSHTFLCNYFSVMFKDEIWLMSRISGSGAFKQENRFDWSFSKDRISGHIVVKV